MKLEKHVILIIAVAVVFVVEIGIQLIYGDSLAVAADVPSKVDGDSEVWTDPITGMEFVKIPAGCFQMGCVADIECEANEKPVHTVCLDGFWMGKYEVTQTQWQQVMGENPSHFTKDRVVLNTSHHPVERVSWNEIQEFIQKLNKQTG